MFLNSFSRISCIFSALSIFPPFLKSNRSRKRIHFLLASLINPTSYKIPDDTILEADGKKTLPHTTLGFGINDEDETIYLKNENGDTIDTWSN